MKNLFVICLCLVNLLSCKNEDDPHPEIMMSIQEPRESADPPANAQISKMGAFTSFAHNLGGNSILYDSVHSKILRFENYNMNQGPDVYVFLSKANNYSSANVLKIAKLTKGYSNASINFDVDSSINLDNYRFVLVYCVQYNSLFGYTELK
jgi:hypothetical protein